jgi:hypothetical protein
MDTCFNDLSPKGKKFCLEIPSYMERLNEARKNNVSAHEQADICQKVIEDNMPLIREVSQFVLANGGSSAVGFGGSVGIVGYGENQVVRAGVTFLGSDTLAQKVAEKFPQHKVFCEDGKPFNQPEKPQKKPFGPKL